MLVSATYSILDNGDKPFWVEMKEKTLTIFHPYKQGRDDDDNIVTLHRKDLHTTPYVRAFDGATDNPEDTGSSILAELPDGRYLYIGSNVYTFTPNSPIVRYHSPIGNSAVPYPYAIDANGSTYLMIENIIDHAPAGNNPYHRLYEYHAQAIHDGTIQTSSHPGWMHDNISDDDTREWHQCSRDEFIKRNNDTLKARDFEIMQITCLFCLGDASTLHSDCGRRDEPYLEDI
jgi:hypothetical protein